MESQGISRRGFLLKAGAAAGGIASLGAGASSALAWGLMEGEGTSDETIDMMTTETAEYQERDSFAIPALDGRPEPHCGYPRTCGDTKPDAMPIAPVEPPSSWDYEADVVIVGTGLGASTAACKLAEGGMSVICIEKDPVTGGASAHASNFHSNHGGTRQQNEIGYYWPDSSIPFDPYNEDDVKRVALEYEAHYQYSVEEKLMMRQVEAGPKYIDWLCDRDDIDLQLIDRFGGMMGGGPVIFKDAELKENGWNNVLGASGVVSKVLSAAQAAGAQVFTSTKAEALVMDGRRCVGVKTSDKEGEKYFRGNKAVILAAGGMGMNLDLLEKYIPTAYMNCAGYGPMPSHTGEVFRMGLGAGADYAGYDSWGNWDGGLDEYWGDGDGNLFHYMYRWSYTIGFMAPMMSIDKCGNRVPHCKANPNLAGKVEPLLAGFAMTSAAMNVAPGHRRYQIWDSKWDLHDLGSVLPGTMFDGVDCASYYHGLRPGAEAFLPESFDIEMANMLKTGAIKRADTIEELEKLCHFETGVMQKAVEKWNADCEAGVDSENTYEMPAEWMVPITEPPFFAVCYGPNLEPTGCGLRVNDKMQVLDRSDNHCVIEGLYATWSTAGGFFGECQTLQFGAVTPMGSLAMSGTSGWVAANALLGEYDA